MASSQPSTLNKINSDFPHLKTTLAHPYAAKIVANIDAIIFYKFSNLLDEEKELDF